LKILELTAGGVERALRQMEDWVRPRPKEGADSSADDL
jgi:hypothetical protein